MLGGQSATGAMKAKAASTQRPVKLLGVFESCVRGASPHLEKENTLADLLGQWGRQATSKQHEVARVQNLRS